MGIAREQLIAEWRERLAAAEQAPAEAAARPAWLVRVRLRMYRFLLSLYGEGVWNVGQAITAPETDEAPDSPVHQDLELADLEGKPAKNDAEIRGVLSGLASARDRPLQPGPLVAGLPAESWVLVGTCRGNANAAEWLAILKQKGLSPRIRRYGYHESIEVPAAQRKEAFEVIDTLRGQRTRPRMVENTGARSWLLAIAGGMGLLSAMFICGTLIGYVVMDWYERHPGAPASTRLTSQQWQAIWDEFAGSQELQFLIFGSIAVAAQLGLLFWLRSRRMTRQAKHAKGGVPTVS